MLMSSVVTGQMCLLELTVVASLVRCQSNVYVETENVFFGSRHTV